MIGNGTQLSNVIILRACALFIYVNSSFGFPVAFQEHIAVILLIAHITHL